MSNLAFYAFILFFSLLVLVSQIYSEAHSIKLTNDGNDSFQSLFVFVKGIFRLLILNSIFLIFIILLGAVN